ncbi:MAG: hypothetical protein NC311_02180 [Muribaculaceae bacterium]|nr:hypothetical protein [Muribaculaceae bacterium]
MKHKIIFTLVALSIYSNCANADMCTTTTTDTPTGYIPYQARDYIQYCTSVTYTNYYSVILSSSAIFSTPQCTACNRGYSLITLSNAEIDWTDSCNDIDNTKITLTICAKPCDSSCVSDDDFDDDGNGIASMIIRECDRLLANKACKISTEYTCSSGYYGVASDDGTSGCTACPYPQNDSHYMANSMPGENAIITDCYIAKSSSYNFSDSTGRYKCTEDAYYKN